MTLNSKATNLQLFCPAFVDSDLSPTILFPFSLGRNLPFIYFSFLDFAPISKMLISYLTSNATFYLSKKKKNQIKCYI